jgi:non-heme chloroperoxidase
MKLEVKDGTHIYYKDLGSGQPIVFSHGWPLSSDAWDAQIFAFVKAGYRCVALDRRGHGRSDQTADGNTMDGYADDLAALVDELALENAIHIGHSTGGGEVARYIARHGTSRVDKIVLISAVPPLMLKTEANPRGTPKEVFDQIRAGVLKDRAQYYRDFTQQFFGANRRGSKVTQGIMDEFVREAMMGGLLPQYESIEAFSATDQTKDLEAFDKPTLILHGDDDQVVPIEAAALQSSKIVKGAILKIYPGAPHGMTVTLADQINKDLLEFIKTGKLASAQPTKGDGERARAEARS